MGERRGEVRTGFCWETGGKGITCGTEVQMGGKYFDGSAGRGM